jgi:ABC-type phosphate transport system permease subunit
MTAFIVQISLGDTPQDSVQFKSLFAVAATLFALTFGLNVLGNRIARYRTRTHEHDSPAIAQSASNCG